MSAPAAPPPGGEGCALLVYSEAKQQHALVVRAAYG
jgi:hypothetical protein